MTEINAYLVTYGCVDCVPIDSTICLSVQDAYDMYLSYLSDYDYKDSKDSFSNRLKSDKFLLFVVSHDEVIRVEPIILDS